MYLFVAKAEAIEEFEKVLARLERNAALLEGQSSEEIEALPRLPRLTTWYRRHRKEGSRIQSQTQAPLPETKPVEFEEGEFCTLFE